MAVLVDAGMVWFSVVIGGARWLIWPLVSHDVP
jgi:hypothetical protein